MAHPKNDQDSEFMVEIIVINRTSKVTRGGRNFGFTAVVVSGDGKGRVGFGTGKSGEVPAAIDKATRESQQNMIKVPLRYGTVPHTFKSTHGASEVFVMPAPSGTGIIAGNAMRAIFKVLGVENIQAKSIGSSNPINVVRATFNGLSNLKTARKVAEKRGISIADVVGEENGEA